MRLNVIIAAVIITAAVFGVANKQTVYAEPIKQQTKAIKITKEAKPKQVVVKPGDYLDKIARANNTTYIRLYNANSQIKNPDLIYPGEVVTIPAANQKLANRLAPKAVPNNTNVPVKTTKPIQTTATRAPSAVLPSNSTVWDRIAQCESGGNWSINTGNGYYGGLQFTLSSWQSVGGSGYPNQASRAEQISRAQILQARQGWGAWPACSFALGLR